MGDSLEPMSLCPHSRDPMFPYPLSSKPHVPMSNPEGVLVLWIGDLMGPCPPHALQTPCPHVEP